MGQFPANAFESFRVRVSSSAVPAWKVRLVMALATLVGVVVFLLLLPLLIFVAILVVVWLAAVRLRMWLAGRGGQRDGGIDDGEGRENVRIIVRDA